MKLRVTLLQYDIAWENRKANMAYVKSVAFSLEGKTDLIVLPEMFTTGFSMNSNNLAEENSGETMSTLKEWADILDIAFSGTFIAKDSHGICYNRGFFIAKGKEYYYDKRHLFRMGHEPASYNAGNSRLVFEHKGFNICLLICYDLRFPVWARNVNNQYDLLIVCANWPKSRIKVWDTLLTARAIENMSFVCGVNRVGVDGENILYNGDSKMIDARGESLLNDLGDSAEHCETIEISKSELDIFRAKFPVWKDADDFRIIE